jgi:hypothetical protein
VDGSVLDQETTPQDTDALIMRDTTHKGYMGALSFTSKRTSHELFDFLLNWTDPRLDVRCSRTPTLISPKPFIGSRLEQAELHRSVVKSKDSKSNLYKLTINGPIIPPHMRELLKMVRSHQSRYEETDCLVVFETDDRTVMKETLALRTIEFKNSAIVISRIN